MFIARASEGALDMEWIMAQPVRIRKKLMVQYQKEMKERQEKLNSKKKPK